MVHGGTSGIGTTAIQLAKAFGAKVIATAGSAEKCKACLEIGADRAINYRSEDFVAAAKEATGGKGVDVTLDMVGGDYTERNISAAAEEGRIVQIAVLGGADVKINIARVMMKRVTLTGSTLRPRTREAKAGFARALEAKVWPLLASGKVRVVMDSTFPLAKAADAHRRLEIGRARRQGGAGGVTAVVPEFREAKYPGPRAAYKSCNPGSRLSALLRSGRDDRCGGTYASAGRAAMGR